MSSSELRQEVDGLFRAWDERNEALSLRLRQGMDAGGDEARALREARDASAQAWVDRVKLYLYSVAFRIVRDRQHAEDAVMATFAIVLHTKSRPSARDAALPWLTRIAMQRALATSRSSRSRAERSLDAALDADPRLEGSISLRDRTEGGRSDRLADEVEAAVRRLPKDRRLALELVGIHDLTYAEAADVLEVPEDVVKTRVRSAKRQVQAMLEGRGIPLGVAIFDGLLAARVVKPPSKAFSASRVEDLPAPELDASRPLRRAGPWVAAASVVGGVAAVALLRPAAPFDLRAERPPANEARQAAAPAAPDSSLTPAPVARVDAAVPPAILRGRVVDPSGAPAPGADVRVTFRGAAGSADEAGARSEATVRSGARGEYTVPVPDSVEYLLVEASVGLTHRSQIVRRRLAADAPVPGFAPGVNVLEDLRLRRGGAIRVRVKLESGEPCAGAHVILTNALQDSTRRALTDAAGVAEIGGAPPGPYRVTVVKDCVARGAGTVVLTSEAPPAEVVCDLGGAFWQPVAVVEAAGSPARGALLFGDGESQATVASGNLGPGAGLRLLCPAGREAELAIRREATATVQRVRTPRAPADGILTFTLPPLTGLAVGCVDAATGAPVPDFEAGVVRASGAWSTKLVKSAGGSAALPFDPTHLTAKPALWVRARGFALARLPVKTGVGSYTVELDRGVEVAGRILDPRGAPAAFARIGAQDAREMIAEAVSKPDGTFVLGRLPRFVKEVSIWRSGGPHAVVAVDLTGAGPRLELGDVRVDDPATLILDLPASAGDGAAFDLTGRAPGAGARPASLERWASLEPGEALAVEGLPPGEWTVSRTFGSLGLRGVRVPVATLALAGGDVKHLTIEGCEPSIVHGAVPRGAVPAEHLEVVALRADAPLFYEASLDASGRFAFDTLPAGYPYVLTIRFRGATQDLACADLTDGWSAAVASVVDPERSAESVLVAALPGRQPPVEFRELPLTAPIDIAGLPRGDGVRVEISADTANGRAFGPWTVALGGDVKPTLDLPPGPYLARVFDGERLLGEVRSVARPRERNVWALPR